MDSSTKAGGYGFAVAALIIGLIIGFGVSKAVDHNSTMNMAPTSATKAADLRANLVTLGVEHMTYTDQAVDAALDGSPGASALASNLYSNGDQIGAAIGSVYGGSAQSTFDKVWKLHLDDFVKYAVADKQGDASGKQAALQDINANYTIPLAQFLAKANPNLPEGTLQTALSDHVAMTAQMIDDHVQGNYTAEANELGMANEHIEGLMSTLASGIVKQYPNKF